ncbi:MAG: formylglycine-generating enzyme family protein [Campylobacteraceae bacterium]|jgi:hypothetical protein|nr:formylglycine-generating enzyme family protein [Campylobacteraceae bacterium]
MSTKYFPTQPNAKFHSRSCPLNSLGQKIIKNFDKSILTKEKDDKFTISTYLNSVAKVLDYKAWNDYLKAYSEEIVPFLEKNGLTNYVDDEKNILSSPMIDFTTRQISDRLFLSGRPLPKAIFTGYGCKMLDASDWFSSQLKLYPPHDNQIECFNTMKKFMETEEYERLLHSWKKADFTIPVYNHILTPYKNLISDLFIKNGDNTQNKYIYQCYQDYKGLVEQKEYVKIAQYIHDILLKAEKGWIEVIPFSEHLIFLKAADGKYDFIFKNLRTEKHDPLYKYLKHKYVSSVFNEDYDFKRWQYFGFKGDVKTAKQVSLWFEKDLHEAKIEFCANNQLYSLPENEILKNYYIKKDLYRPPYKYNKKKLEQKEIDGFNRVTVEDKNLFVSNCITIEEFLKFCEETRYAEDRCKKLPKIKTARITLEGFLKYYAKNRSLQLQAIKEENKINIQELLDDYIKNEFLDLKEVELVEYEKDIPITVTQYDAIAYCNWMEEKYKIKARLLTAEEFRQLCPKTDESEYNDNLMSLIITDGTIFINTKGGTIPTSKNDPFDDKTIFIDKKEVALDDVTKVLMLYRKPLKYIEKDGLIFYANKVLFREWLFGNELIRDQSFYISNGFADLYPPYNYSQKTVEDEKTCFLYNPSIDELFAFDNVARYETCFRVCYEGGAK